MRKGLLVAVVLLCMVVVGCGKVDQNKNLDVDTEEKNTVEDENPISLNEVFQGGDFEVVLKSVEFGKAIQEETGKLADDAYINSGKTYLLPEAGKVAVSATLTIKYTGKEDLPYYGIFGAEFLYNNEYKFNFSSKIHKDGWNVGWNEATTWHSDGTRSDYLVNFETMDPTAYECTAYSFIPAEVKDKTENPLVMTFMFNGVTYTYRIR